MIGSPMYYPMLVVLHIPRAASYHTFPNKSIPLSIHSFGSLTVRRPLMGCDDNLFIMRNLSCRSLGQGREKEQTLLELGGGGLLGGSGPE